MDYFENNKLVLACRKKQMDASSFVNPSFYGDFDSS